MFYCKEVIRDNGNVLLDDFLFFVEVMRDDKWLILGQEMQQVWIRKLGIFFFSWEFNLIVYGRSLILGVFCGYFGIFIDLII